MDLKFSERDKERLSAELNQSKRLTLDTERLESENKRLSAELNQSKGLTLDTNQLESEKQELRKSLTQQESRRQDFEVKISEEMSTHSTGIFIFVALHITVHVSK